MYNAIRRTLYGFVVLVFLAGCGAEPPQEPAAPAQVETQRVDDHEECDAGGVEILIDGDVDTVVCDGEPGDEGPTGEDGAEGPAGEDGLSPEITTEHHEDHSNCPAGGTDILVDGDVETTICDGEDGEDGEDATAPQIDTEYDEAHDECPAGGTDILVDGDVETTICDGDSPAVTTRRFEQHNECPAGGIEVLVDDEVEDVVCDGVSPTVTTDHDPNHPECPAGGVDILIDGEPEAHLCDGEEVTLSNVDAHRVDEHPDCDGRGGTSLTFSFEDADDAETHLCDGADGEDGETPDVETHRDEEHPDCDGRGGTTITFTYDNETIETHLCDGTDGDDGDDGETPDIITDRDPAHPECEDGGTTITFSFEDAGDTETYVCDGTDGEDGDVPGITVTDLADTDVDHECGDEPGGYLLSIEQPDSYAADVVVCRDETRYQINQCEIETPESPHQWRVGDPSTEFAGTVGIEISQGDPDAGFPEDFEAELGISDIGVDPDPDEEDQWAWHAAEVNDTSDGDALSADFSLRAGDDELEPGEYRFVFRITADRDIFWRTCGIDGLVELDDYDSDEDGGVLDVDEGQPEVLPYWNFEADDEEDRLFPVDGNGHARFSDAEDDDLLGSTEFTSGVDDNENAWHKEGDWSTESEFPGSDFDEAQYFEYYSPSFADYDTIFMELDLNRSSTGPERVQIVAVFDNGALAKLDEPLELLTDSWGSGYDAEVSPDALEAFEGDPDGADIVTYRVYGYDADTIGGTLRMDEVDFSGN